MPNNLTFLDKSFYAKNKGRTSLLSNLPQLGGKLFSHKMQIIKRIFAQTSGIIVFFVQIFKKKTSHGL